MGDAKRSLWRSAVAQAAVFALLVQAALGAFNCAKPMISPSGGAPFADIQDASALNAKAPAVCAAGFAAPGEGGRPSNHSGGNSENCAACIGCVCCAPPLSAPPAAAVSAKFVRVAVVERVISGAKPPAPRNRDPPLFRQV